MTTGEVGRDLRRPLGLYELVVMAVGESGITTYLTAEVYGWSEPERSLPSFEAVARSKGWRGRRFGSMSAFPGSHAHDRLVKQSLLGGAND